MGGLIAVWVACAAWSLARVPPVHVARATAAAGTSVGAAADDEHDEAPGDNPQAGGPASRGLHEDEEGPAGGEAVNPTPGPAPHRGIRPPWRENAIPELRNQPGKRARKMTS